MNKPCIAKVLSLTNKSPMRFPSNRHLSKRSQPEAATLARATAPEGPSLIARWRKPREKEKCPTIFAPEEPTSAPPGRGEYELTLGLGAYTPS